MTPTTKKPRDPERALPLKPLIFQLLLGLVDTERHPYGIRKDLAARTDGKMAPGPGTLYRAIAQMLDAGLIEESDRRPVAELDDERRRYYRLTTYGRAVATAEARRLAALVSSATARKLIQSRS